jgi:glycosyltransferase involved in cell wall biosynthesis
MKSYFYLVCLKYTPGMWQHMASFAHRLMRRGGSARLLISPDFSWMNEQFAAITHYNFSDQISWRFKKIISYVKFKRSHYGQIFQEYPPMAFLFVSWHTLNLPLIRMIKSIYPKAKILFWLHEPYKDEKKKYGFKAIIIWFIEFLQTLCLRYGDGVILHSRRGLRLFEKRYPNFKGIRRVVPLQFQDDGFDATVPRRYVSFLGRADKAKGIEAFFALVERTAQTNPDREFQIVTSSYIEAYLQRLSPQARQKLRVVNKMQLADGDLRDGVANSLAVLALYKETMQSGIIPVALMKGTPVIGTDIEGITEWIRDRETGVIVPRDPSAADIEAAISFIEKELPAMSPRCRDYYLATFDDRNWDRDYGWLREFLPLRNGSLTAS